MKWVGLIFVLTGLSLLITPLELTRVANWYLHFTAVIPNWTGWVFLSLGMLGLFLRKTRV
jgi:hypothetical protein